MKDDRIAYFPLRRLQLKHILSRFFIPLFVLVSLLASAIPGYAREAAPIADPNLSAAAACGDGSESADFPRYARLKHDFQWMDYPSRMADPDWSWGGANQADWYPQTVPLWVSPRSGDGRVPYTREWLEYLRDLQPDLASAVWITKIAAGLFNRVGNVAIPITDLDELEQAPVAESISTGGNVVKVLETKNGSARIEMLFLNSRPPNPDVINYETTPWLVFKFTSISTDGRLGNANGLDVYFPNLSKQAKGYWVDMKRIEMFPNLPRCIAAKQDLRILSAPAGLVKHVGSLSQGQQVTLLEYLPQGSDVWGRIEQGWIRLEYLNLAGEPVYTTSWDMDTRPPILFP